MRTPFERARDARANATHAAFFLVLASSRHPVKDRNANSGSVYIALWNTAAGLNA